jgi:hypothetical protein
MAAGVYVSVGYEFFHWEEGLNVMIWHDAVSNSSCDSSGSTDDAVHTVICHAVSGTGKRFDWQIETLDGLTGEFRINDKPFDLSEGRIFIVTTSGGAIDIQQEQGDLSSVKPESESIVAYGLDNEDIKQFIQSNVSQ